MRNFLILVFAGLIAAAGHSEAGVDDEIRTAYSRFAAAQNARDMARVGESFIDGPDLLWVSDGRSFWGREAILQRMSLFQRSEVWRVEPELDAARIVETGPEAAMLHMPLTLVIGAAESPSRLRFLVSILFVRNGFDWRISALLTTNEKK